MSHAIKALLISLVLALAACERPSSTDFLDTNGNGYRYADLEGKWQVINYWATWCAPCIKEIPELIALGEKHDNIVVFGVNFDAPQGDEIAQQIEKMGITFPVYSQDPQVRLGFQMPEVLPTTVLIDPAGNVADVLVGPQTEASLLLAMGITETLNSAKTSPELPQD